MVGGGQDLPGMHQHSAPLCLQLSLRGPSSAATTLPPSFLPAGGVLAACLVPQL